MKSNSISRKIVKETVNNNRFRVTWHGTKQPFTSLDSTDILKSFEIFDVTLYVLKNQVFLNQFHGQITSNFLTQASWRLYEIRQPPIFLCTTSNFLINTTIETFHAGHLGGRALGALWGQGGSHWGHWVALMGLLLIHKAYIFLYTSDQDFHCGWTGL